MEAGDGSDWTCRAGGGGQCGSPHSKGSPVAAVSSGVQ